MGRLLEMIYADQRWIGDHGIGRFARHVLAELEYRPVTLSSNPAGPLDSWRLTRELRRLTQNDLFFSPGYNSPISCPAPFIFTIHDLNHIDRPENSSTLKRLYYATVLKRSCNRAKQILTVSEFSRTRIVEWTGISQERVVNVRCGVDDRFNPNVTQYNLPFPYLLCVSNRKPHKNEARTVEAFARARLSPSIHLVFTGRATTELAAVIETFRLTEFVHFVGTVPDAELPSLYRGAEALVFVSLYEGFGLPVLEAMACGTPVLTANVSALPEVAGGATMLVDPVSVDEIAGAMRQIVEDTFLRQQLRLKGLIQAAHFSWDATSTRVRELLACAIIE